MIYITAGHVSFSGNSEEKLIQHLFVSPDVVHSFLSPPSNALAAFICDNVLRLLNVWPLLCFTAQL